MKPFQCRVRPTALNLLKVSNVVHCQFQNIGFFEFTLSDLREGNMDSYKWINKTPLIKSYIAALTYTYVGAVVAF